MPHCSTARNPRGVEIVFTEEDHKYTSVINGKQISYMSGTQFLGKYFPQFDPDGSITKKCALKEGISPEELKKRWADKGKESCRLGTRMHERLEDLFLSRQVRNTPEDDTEKKRFDNAVSIGQKIMQRLDIVGVEKIVFSDQLGIAGTIDFLGKSKKDGTYIIIDHKSNAKIEQDNFWKKFCLGPLSHVPDNSFYHYALQLNLYEYLLKHEQYVQKDAKFALFLNHVTADKAQLIKLPDMQSEIKDLMIDFLLSKIAIA